MGVARTASLLVFLGAAVGCSDSGGQNLASNSGLDTHANVSAEESIGREVAPPTVTSGPANPSAREARRALNRMLEASGIGFVSYAPVGRPANCVDGRDSSGRIVRTCDVCAVVLTSSRQWGLKIERSDFSVPFQRAISAEQPDISPMEGADGVWVATISSRPPGGYSDLPRSQTYFEKAVETADLEPLGMRVQDNGTVCLPPNSPGGLGLCVLSGSSGVMNALATPQASSRMREIAGRCS